MSSISTLPVPGATGIRRRHEPVQLSAVRSSRLFRDLDPAVTGLVAMNADIVRLRDGQTIASAGRHAHQVVIVLDGFVEVTDRRGHTVVAGAGTEVGARSIAERLPSQESVAACGDVEVLVIYGPTFAWALGAARALSARVVGHPAAASTAAVPVSAPVAASAVGSTVFTVRPSMVPA